MDPIHGITLDDLADIMSKQGELRARHGEAQGRTELQAYLAARSLTENDWALAHNAWLERFRADPTGKLEARFHQMLSERSTKAHFGDVRDMSQDVAWGVTLDTYAQLVVALSKPGVDAEAVVRAHGVSSVEGWVRVNDAWATKMKEDTTFKLMTQYGALYQKYDPALAQQQLEQTAAALAESNEPRDVVNQPKADLSQATLLRKLRSTSRNERWEAARWLAHQWKKNDPSTQVNLECVPVLIDILEHHDEHTTTNAEDAAEKLTRDLELHTDEVKFAVWACLTRAKEKLATLEEAFAPIKDRAVPERATMQTRIDEHKALIRTMESVTGRLATPVKSAMPPAARVSAPPASRGASRSLLAIPIVIAIAAAALWKTMGGAAAPSSASSSSSSPSPSPSSVEAKAEATPAAPAPGQRPIGRSLPPTKGRPH